MAQFPSKVSRIVHKHRKPVAEMITTRLKSTNFENKVERTKLVSWLNGVAVPETNDDVRREILKLRKEVMECKKE